MTPDGPSASQPDKDADPTPAPLLELSGLRTDIRLKRATVHALDGVDLHVDPGESLGIVGESGCGKTMTALSVLQLLPVGGSVVGGQVRFAGRPLTGLGAPGLRAVRGNEIGMIFQDPMTSLNPTQPIGTQIAESVRIHRGADRATARRRAVEVLRLVGMPHPERTARSYPHQLSGGMRQRAMIGIALACEPRLLIADEPTTALDVTVQKQILELIDGLRGRLGMAVLLITHDLGVVAGRCDRVAVMYAGKVVETATTDDLFAHPHHPYTEALFEALPEKAAYDPHARLYSIPGRPPDLTDPPTGCRFRARCRYAADRCATEEPPLDEVAPGHRAACFFPVGTPSARSAHPPTAAPTRPGGPTPEPIVKRHAVSSPPGTGVPVDNLPDNDEDHPSEAPSDTETAGGVATPADGTPTPSEAPATLSDAQPEPGVSSAEPDVTPGGSDVASARPDVTSAEPGAAAPETTTAAPETTTTAPERTAAAETETAADATAAQPEATAAEPNATSAPLGTPPAETDAPSATPEPPPAADPTPDHPAVPAPRVSAEDRAEPRADVLVAELEQPPIPVSSDAPLLELRDVVRDYPVFAGAVLRRRIGTVSAVAGVSLTVAAGETLGLVGESGCGKSTIGRLIVGLEPPTSGEVVFRGTPLAQLSRGSLRRVRRDIQLMFQDSAAAMNPRMRMAGILREPLAVQHVGTRAEQQARILRLLNEVGLGREALERYPHEFSGGQRQRLGLARALALEPRLIVADEPVSALDVSIQAQILNVMRDLQRHRGLAYVFISHDLSVVRHLSDRIGVMYLGKLVEIGPAASVHDSPAHPYTRALIDTVPIADPATEKQRTGTGLPGEPPSATNPPSGCRFRTRCPRAQDLCAEKEPPLRPFTPEGHRAACHFPLWEPRIGEAQETA